MLASSPRNGASTSQSMIAEGSDAEELAEELLGTSVLGACGSSRLSPHVRRGLLVGALLLSAAATAALFHGTKEQVHPVHDSSGLRPALHAEPRFGFVQLDDDGDEGETDGDDQDDEVDGDEDNGDDDEADEDDGDEDAEMTTMTTMTTATPTGTTTTTTEEPGPNEEAHDPRLAGIDKDGNGEITGDEWHDFVDSVRDEMPDITDKVEDTLRDYYDGGELNYYELDLVMYHLWYLSVEKGFKTYDKNGDGELAKHEIYPYAKELEKDFGLSSQDFNDIFDMADNHKEKVRCVTTTKQDVAVKWKWEECDCLEANDSKLTLCEMPGLLHAINLYFKKKLEKS